MNTRLTVDEMHTAGRYGYFAVEAEGGSRTILSGITRKLANTIIGIIHNEINRFILRNQLATLLQDLQSLRLYMGAMSSDKDRVTLELEPEEKAAALRVYNWLFAHQVKCHTCMDGTFDECCQLAGHEPEESEEAVAYLSPDRERYAREEEARRARDKQQA